MDDEKRASEQGHADDFFFFLNLQTVPQELLFWGRPPFPPPSARPCLRGTSKSSTSWKLNKQAKFWRNIYQVFIQLMGRLREYFLPSSAPGCVHFHVDLMVKASWAGLTLQKGRPPTALKAKQIRPAICIIMHSVSRKKNGLRRFSSLVCLWEKKRLRRFASMCGSGKNGFRMRMICVNAVSWKNV